MPIPVVEVGAPEAGAEVAPGFVGLVVFEVVLPGRSLGSAVGEGAAGSLYVEVPVRTYGLTSKGEKFEQPGTVTLRRVNDVDGATPTQLRWTIRSSSFIEPTERSGTSS